MKVKFWGTRGSLPKATSNQEFIGEISRLLDDAAGLGIKNLTNFRAALTNGQLGHPLSYGGNTSCIEVASDDDSMLIDMGSGLREAGTLHMSQGRKTYHIFLTHMHWDHVMGLPFFVPIYVPDCSVKIYHVHRNAPEHVRINFNGVNFPLTFDQLTGQVTFQQLKLYVPVQIGGCSVTPFVLDHPGGSFGYRFDAEGKSCAVGVDGEFKRITAKDLGKDLPYYQNLDLLVFDAQYELTELASRFDWGHSSPTIGVNLALREGIRQIAFSHHDPWSSAVKLQRMLEDAMIYRSTQLPTYKAVWDQLGQPEGPKLFNAYDGLDVAF